MRSSGALATGLVLAMCGSLSGCGSCWNRPEAPTVNNATSAAATTPSTSASLEQLVRGVSWPVIDAEGTPVKVTLDQSRAAKATIGRDGGTVTAVGADGTKYVLTIPARAITFATEVVVTPVQEFGTFEVAGARRFAVDFAPHGLLLFRAATLDVQPANNEMKGGAFAISYLAEGVAPSLTPVLPKSDSLRVPVHHFSGAAIYLGEGVAVPIPPPAPSSWSEAESKIADLARQARDGDIDNGELVDGTNAVLDGYFESTLLPNLARMYSDCDYAKRHLGEYLTFFTYAEMMGGGEARYAERLTSNGVLKGVLENCWKERSQDCIRYDPRQIRELIGLLRQLEITGVATPAAPQFKPCGNVSGQFRWSGEYRSQRGSYSSVDRHEATVFVTGQWDGDSYDDRGSRYAFAQHMSFADPSVIGGCSGTSRGTGEGQVDLTLQIMGTEALLTGFVGATSMAARQCPRPETDSQPNYGSFVTCPETDSQAIKGKVEDGRILLTCSGEDTSPHSDGTGKDTYKYESQGWVTLDGYDIDFLTGMLHEREPG